MMKLQSGHMSGVTANDALTASLSDEDFLDPPASA